MSSMALIKQIRQWIFLVSALSRAPKEGWVYELPINMSEYLIFVQGHQILSASLTQLDILSSISRDFGDSCHWDPLGHHRSSPRKLKKLYEYKLFFLTSLWTTPRGTKGLLSSLSPE